MKVITFFNFETITGILCYQSVEDEFERKTRLRYYDVDGDQIPEFCDDMMEVLKSAERYCEGNDLILWGY